ncbi:MAG: hypothetical protein Q7P63_09700 [Verrucomicrobiota bacterium JB022]|nr:hypothetical protein [Verrucomicrobiota bacterium JB022]
MHLRSWTAFLGLVVGCWLGLSPALTAQSLLDRLKGEDEITEQPSDPEPAADPANTPAAEPLRRVSSADDLSPAFEAHDGSPLTVYVVPITDVISKPNEFILRRASKEAIAHNVDVLVLDMNTPGGRLDVMLEIMEGLQSFDGLTIAYVNKEAVSAGAFIAFAADEIWYAPGAVIGAAEAITSTGESIEGGMKRKLDSYMQAKMRAMQAEHPHKADVMRAMSDPDFVLERDGQVLKTSGSLLSLTAEEAMARYGEPPVPLFGVGIAPGVEALLDQRFGEGIWTLERYEVSAAEHFAKYLDMVSPLLLTIGIMLLFIEFKTPGFGVFGATGLTLIGVFFASQFVAGLAGYEVFVIFAVGCILLFVEIFITPGGFVLGLIGACMLLGSLVWGLADVWPSDTSPVGVTVSLGSVLAAAWELVAIVIAAIILFALAVKNMHRLPFHRDLVLTSAPTPAGAAQDIPAVQLGSQRKRPDWPDLGTCGVVTRDLHPLGEVEVDGQRFAASVPVGLLKRGERIKVTAYGTFNLIVEREDA